jgi:hypothetical protein
MVSYVEPNYSKDQRHEPQDSEAERLKIGDAAVRAVTEYEKKYGRVPIVMADGNPGYDVISTNEDGTNKRLIEAAIPPTPACNSTSNAATSISFAGTPGPVIFRPVLRNGQKLAIGHLYARNDSGFPLSQWCFRGYFLDYLDQPENVVLSLNGVQQLSNDSCITLNVNAGIIQDFSFSIAIKEAVLPISGFVALKSSGTKEEQHDSDAMRQNVLGQRPRARANQPPEKCIATSKEISQIVVVPSTESTYNAEQVILTTGLIGGVFLIACLWKFKGKLTRPMGSSQWTFSSSAATNLAVVGSLLGVVLVSSSIPDFPHQMSKQSFIVVGLTFAVLAGLSPILYNFLCKPIGPNSTNPQILDFEGWVWLFLVADALTIWAACGQLATLMLLFNEFAIRQFISKLSVVCAWSVAIAVAMALLNLLLSHCPFLCRRTSG